MQRRPGPKSRTQAALATQSLPNSFVESPAADAVLAPSKPESPVVKTGIQDVVASAATAPVVKRPRPGPLSRTKPPGYNVETCSLGGPTPRAPVTPSADALRQVEASRRLSGKNLEELKKARKSSRKATLPSQATKHHSSKGSAKKRRRRSVSESSRDSDEDPELLSFVQTLPDVRLTPDEYLVHIPAKARNTIYFNCSIQCPACKEPFPASMSQETKTGTLLPSTHFYTHCLSMCPGYMNKMMGSCDDCCHRYLREELATHKRSGYCTKYAKKMKNLKLKMPWMQRQLFLDLLDLQPNAFMCCPGCRDTFDCHKKGNVYTPTLILQTHMLGECPAFVASGASPDSLSCRLMSSLSPSLDATGKRIECRKCAKDGGVFYYISEEDFKKYDPCYVPSGSDGEKDDDDRNDPNSPYYGKGWGRGKEPLSSARDDA